MSGPVLDRRRAGVLLHPTALISESGSRGALGAAARGFVDWLSQAGFSLWQMLPIGPPGGDSPYWARSDFAGNVALVDRSELPDPDAARNDYETFREASRAWLEPYVAFETLAARLQSPWWQWPRALRLREPEALARIQAEAGAELERRRLEQWQFDWQWRRLRRYAHERGVLLFGDLPIYVAPDSVATWAHPEQFRLDAAGRPGMLAGVPPDYFAADGQLWGNPLYDWQCALGDGFAFWRARLAQQLHRFDLVRIDHFRGLVACWAVPAGAATARAGHWEEVPGEALFRALRAAHPALPLVAEDLGIITPEVEALRRGLGLPGMRVLQFGFDGSSANPHLPHNHTADCVVYAGTHDNDTTLGWYRALDPGTAAGVDFYFRCDADGVLDAVLRAALGSVAQAAILSATDLLRLGSEARFNTPGTTQGNWRWRLPAGGLDAPLAAHYAALNRAFGR